MPTTPSQLGKDRPEVLGAVGGQAERPHHEELGLPVHPGEMRPAGDCIHGDGCSSSVLLPGRTRALKVKRLLFWVAGISGWLYIIADRLAHLFGFCLGV